MLASLSPTAPQELHHLTEHSFAMYAFCFWGYLASWFLHHVLYRAGGYYCEAMLMGSRRNFFCLDFFGLLLCPFHRRWLRRHVSEWQSGPCETKAEHMLDLTLQDLFRSVCHACPILKADLRDLILQVCFGNNQISIALGRHTCQYML